MLNGTGPQINSVLSRLWVSRRTGRGGEGEAGSEHASRGTPAAGWVQRQRGKALPGGDLNVQVHIRALLPILQWAATGGDSFFAWSFHESKGWGWSASWQGRQRASGPQRRAPSAPLTLADDKAGEKEPTLPRSRRRQTQRGLSHSERSRGRSREGLRVAKPGCKPRPTSSLAQVARAP